MALRRKIHHHIGLFFFKKSVNPCPVADIHLYKAEIGVLHHRCQGRQIARVGQLVQADDAIAGVFPQHMENKITSDKSGAAGHNYGHS